MKPDYSQITKKYGIKFKEIKSNADAELSSVFILDNKYILRARDLNKNTVKILTNELSLLDELRKLVSYKLPDPLKTLNGEKYVIFDNSLWTLYPFIPGKIVTS